MKKDKLTLATICDGQVQLMVDRALEAVGQNIADPNMDPKKVREVNISIKLAPREKDREDVKVTVAITKKLAAEQALETNFYVTQDLRTNRITIQEHRKGQIKGQLSIEDVEEEFDRETGEIYEQKSLLDYRRKEG